MIQICYARCVVCDFCGDVARPYSVHAREEDAENTTAGSSESTAKADGWKLLAKKHACERCVKEIQKGLT